MVFMRRQRVVPGLLLAPPCAAAAALSIGGCCTSIWTGRQDSSSREFFRRPMMSTYLSWYASFDGVLSARAPTAVRSRLRDGARRPCQPTAQSP